MINGIYRCLIVCHFAIGMLMVSCKNEISEIRALTDVQNKPVQSSYNAEYRFTEKGILKNKLFAAQIDQYKGEQEYIEATGGFEMLFFDSTETEEARLTARNGRYAEGAKRLQAWEKVVLRNTRGEKLETEELIFQQDSARIYTDKYVVITLANGSVIHGHGLESNDSFTRYRIIRPSGELYMNQEETTHANPQ